MTDTAEIRQGDRAPVVDGPPGLDDGHVIVDLRRDDVAIDHAIVKRGPVAFVDLRAEYLALKDDLDAAVARVVEAGDFILGSAVAEFEERFAAYCGVSHAVGVDSGWSALELALRAYGIGPGDEVITVANTFMATVGAIEAAGAKPVLVDCDPVTYNIDPEQLAAAVTPRTRAVIPVHLYGQPADMAAVNAVAGRHGLLVVEDACQAHGAAHHGRRAGSLGHAAAFSFYPAKNLGAFGDGGMVVTDDADIARRLRLLRNLGSPEKYRHSIRGFNRRLDSLHAAVLGVKLGSLDDWNRRRRRVARIYRDMLADLPIVTPRVPAGIEAVFHLYVIQAEPRDALKAHLAEERVATGIHYPTPIHLLEAYEDMGYRRGDFPVAERLAGRILSLPMHPRLGLGDIAKVVGSVRSFFRGAGA